MGWYSWEGSALKLPLVLASWVTPRGLLAWLELPRMLRHVQGGAVSLVCQLWRLGKNGYTKKIDRQKFVWFHVVIEKLLHRNWGLFTTYAKPRLPSHGIGRKFVSLGVLLPWDHLQTVRKFRPVFPFKLPWKEARILNRHGWTEWPVKRFCLVPCESQQRYFVSCRRNMLKRFSRYFRHGLKIMAYSV